MLQALKPLSKITSMRVVRFRARYVRIIGPHLCINLKLVILRGAISFMFKRA